jgi:hypothetical protein
MFGPGRTRTATQTLRDAARAALWERVRMWLHPHLALATLWSMKSTNFSFRTLPTGSVSSRLTAKLMFNCNGSNQHDST